jgi:hypothetical protein
MTISVKMINSQIRKISDTNTLLDMLLEFEKFLDDCNLYAYKNWIDGELVAGPELERHWITAKLMYPYKKMPDPNGAKRLMYWGCMVKYEKSTLITPVKIRSFDDVELKMRPDGTQRYKTKTQKQPVWLIDLRMPRKFVDQFAPGIVEAAEDSYVDLENLSPTSSDNNNSQQQGASNEFA